ncbi:MAG: MFS transporter [Candidatus Poseidoniaceae archaeon]|nr:MFS transporter [Candidatus Poseidoniaceae archaeon]
MGDIGYLQLLRSNSNYRSLWLASVISMLGEWFNTIALFFLILEYTGSEFLLGFLFTVRMISFAIFQPFIGLLADRYNRKVMMVVTNVVQIFLALGFILVDSASDILWMIALSGLMMLLHGAYMTAERAAIPNVVSPEHLTTANALDAASWSTALCIGALLGGIVVSNWGTDAAFIIDSITFAIGTILLIPVKIQQNVEEEMKTPLFKTAFSNIKRGWLRVYTESRLLRIVFAKSSWNIAGGALAGVFLVLLGAETDGYGAAMGFGIFFFARGVGTGLGPIIARNVLKDESKWPGLIGKLVVVSGTFYILVSLTLEINLLLTVILILLAHAASGANWVLSTILTQRWVEDEMRGRVFSIDMLFMSIAFSISTSVAGYLVENYNLGIADGILFFGSMMVLSGILFTLWNPSTSKSATQP